MKKIVSLIVLVPLVLGLMGCDLLTFNLFEGMDAPAIPSADEFGDMPADELLDLLEQLLESDTFYDDLDEAQLDAILAALQEIMDSADSPVDQLQDAALLAAEIELNSTDGGTVVDTVVDVVDDIISEGLDESSTPEAFFTDLIKTAFADVPPENFDDTVAAFLSAAAAFTIFGNSLIDLDGDGTIDGPPGSNMGAIAQDAIVAIIIASVITDMGAAALEDIAYGEGTVSSSVGNPMEDNPALNNIIEAAGMTELFDFGGAA